MRIRKGTKVVQVKIGEEWKFVFCWNPEQGRIITTSDYRKAQPTKWGGLEYFQSKQGNLEFRAIAAG